MPKGLHEDVARHIHLDQAVTDELLKRFALDGRKTQLAVLSELRKRSVDDNVELPLIAIILAFVLPFLSIFALHETEAKAPLWVTVILASVFALVITIVVTIAFGLGPMRRHSQRVNALVWLPAFEDELTRRRGMTGRQARAWRRVH